MKLIAPALIAAFVATTAVSAFAAEAGAAKPQPDLAKGQASFTAVCAACHGPDGNSGTPTYPKLAEQHPQYIIKQLTEFKSGKRNNNIMMGMATPLSEDDMRNIAYWVSSNKAKEGFAKEKDLVILGERIYRGGIADRSIPACAGCHGPTGAGIPAQYPRLSGQHAEYAAAQLTAFRDGVRNNSPQMSQVAEKLNDKEIKALADYIAGLH